MEDGEELLTCSNNLISRGCGLHLEADEQLLTGLFVDTPAFDSRSMFIQIEALFLLRVRKRPVVTLILLRYWSKELKV